MWFPKQLKTYSFNLKIYISKTQEIKETSMLSLLNTATLGKRSRVLIQQHMVKELEF